MEAAAFLRVKFDLLTPRIGVVLGSGLGAVADAVAAAMKKWAIEKGATHYAHVFFPLTGQTAEKHDSFLSPDGEGNAITSFGSYGNMDSRGAGSPVPEPEIPFGWPLSVNCGGGKAFVAGRTEAKGIEQGGLVGFEESAGVQVKRVARQVRRMLEGEDVPAFVDDLVKRTEAHDRIQVWSY